MAAHEQTWVRVNAQVDKRMARIVSALSQIEGLQTLQSCQGNERGSEAYIYFWYGPWQETCRFVFAALLPALQSAGIEDVNVSVEVFNGSLPTGKIGFSARALERATLAVEAFVNASG